jgi:hypothetical protein
MGVAKGQSEAPAGEPDGQRLRLRARSMPSAQIIRSFTRILALMLISILRRDEFCFICLGLTWQRTSGQVQAAIPPLSVEVRQIQMSELWLWNNEVFVIFSDAL